MAEIYLHHRKDKRLYASVYRSVFSPGSHNHQPKISFEIVLMNMLAVVKETHVNCP